MNERLNVKCISDVYTSLQWDSATETRIIVSIC